MEKRTTLTDIAKVVGVTPATVQRALKGIEGVGEEQRRRIQQVAEEMDYRPNGLASALKKGKQRLAVVLPSMEGESRYYASCLWNGVRRYLEKDSEFGAVVHEFPYERSPENLGQALQRMYDQVGGEVDGVITMGVEDPLCLEILGKLDERNVPYVFVGTDCKGAGRLCCVSSCDEMAGRLTADLFLNLGPGSGEGKIILTGDFTIEDQERNARGFEREIRECGGRFETIRLGSFQGIDMTTRTLIQFLNTDMNIAGLYSCSARNTIAVCRAMEESGRTVMAVGSDVFPENAGLLRQGRLAAVIHKRPFDQAYRAAELLMDWLVKGQKPETDGQQAVPMVVLRGNLECFEKQEGPGNGQFL